MSKRDSPTASPALTPIVANADDAFCASAVSIIPNPNKQRRARRALHECGMAIFPQDHVPEGSVSKNVYYNKHNLCGECRSEKGGAEGALTQHKTNKALLSKRLV
jgi:hypothetical protein